MEFTGYLTGDAEKYFHKRMRVLGQNILLASMLLLSPAIVIFSIRFRSEVMILIYLASLVTTFLLTLIPKSKKEKREITPRKITVEEDYIVCVANRYTETRLISEVKQVRDFGEFYELCFPFGRISDKFICQKSLLTKGSIQEFEALFEGKIIRSMTG